MLKKDHNKVKIAIGNVLRKHRERMDLNEVELALLIYGKKSAQVLISRSELAKRNIPTHELMEYIKIFKINPSEFFNQIQKEFSRL